MSNFSLLIPLLFALISRNEAWTANQLSRKFMTNTYLSSLASAERDNKTDLTGPKDIDDELQRGRLLEGGQVIDFSSVKASSKAEEALASARQRLLANIVAPTSDTNGQILGINDDVVGEVGHPLGAFATPEEVQSCATWIRSKAPEGLFQAKDGVSNDASGFSDQQMRTARSTLSKCYDESGEVTGAFAKTFYMGTKLLGEEAQKAIWAIYVWCRRTDEIVDAPRDNDDEMLVDLSAWEMRLENLWDYGVVEDVYDLALLDVRANYPSLDITPFMDMIRGMLMDVPVLGQDRYDVFDELHLYCYRVAGTVGLMSLPVFGCAEGYDDEVAR
mmetsp:Transcript_33227/g.69212  ORF Transcript_33227/g.69212 Transcript_33227/m.69212 type:complete len:331 (-) Transcript_33227:153-1145(-)